MNSKAEQSFANAIRADNVLDLALDWIRANLSPQDVFGTDALNAWASDNGWISEVEADRRVEAALWNAAMDRPHED